MPSEAHPIESILAAAVEMESEAARREFVERACGGDAELKRRLEVLIENHFRAGSFLESPAAAPAATVEAPIVSEGAGTVIRPYKLLQQIGEGGMGTVWMAEQQEPVRRLVALKIIKPGMDSAQVIARFEAERQALALMDHPNIAKVLDAGTTADRQGDKETGRQGEKRAPNDSCVPDSLSPCLPVSLSAGRPFFVMELVKGTPITKYCDEHRLTPRQRLELFVPVCQAIQHAHQKGIIHRDVKPSNVMVAPYDGKPVVKVIDFGVAKATGQRLTERTLFTGFGAVVGTLEYMSPEQAELNNQDIDTRSDIYSLGVLLYELLTGTTPLTKERLKEAAFTEMLRLIREEEPPKPSTRLSMSGALATLSAQRNTEPAKLTHIVRGELDWIVMKALEKDRNRRYEAASGLARDIERYLHDEPVQAGPPNSGYRLRKFVKRNRGPVTAAAVVLLALLAGIVGTTLGLVEAWHQQEVTEQARKDETKQRGIAETNERKATKARDEARGLAQKEKAARERAEENERAAKFEAYRAETARHAIQMDLGLRAWERHDLERAEAVLDNVPGLFQSTWEYRHLRGVCRRKCVTLKGGMVAMRSLCFSPDGQRLAGASGNGTVHVWDAKTGTKTLTVNAHPDWHVLSVCFSPDGKRLASASTDRTVKVWDAQTGKEELTLNGHTWDVTSVCFSPDGNRVASASGHGDVLLWDARTGKKTLTLEAHTDGGGGVWYVWSVCFRPDGTWLASASEDGTVKVWDANTGQEVRTLSGHTDAVKSVCFSPDGKRLASAGDHGSLRVWDAQTGKDVLALNVIPIRGFAGLSSVCFSRDGKRLAAASADWTVRVWDAQTGKEELTLNGHTDRVFSVSFSPDAERLASASGDGTVRVWVPQTRQQVLTLKGHTGEVFSVCFSADRTRLASASADNTVKVWDAHTLEEERTLKGHTGWVTGVRFSPDGKRLATTSADRTVRVWDAHTGRVTLSFKAHTGFLHTGQEHGVCFSPDGKHLAAACDDRDEDWEKKRDVNKVRVWHLDTAQEVLTLRQHTLIGFSVCFSPDGKRLAGASSDKTARVWNAQTGKEELTLEGHTAHVNGMAFSPDGKRLASASADRTVKVWDAQTGIEALTLKGHTGQVTSVCFSPDGNRLATASSDKTVRLWDAQSGQEVLALRGHTDYVWSVCFSPEGNILASASKDGMVNVWEAPVFNPDPRAPR